MDGKRDYKQLYHANIPRAWSNDPNGMIWFGGKAHLFCQYNPDKPQWGPMHWGHFVSEDLLHWEFLPVALTPDEPYEAVCGCFSGTSIVIDDRLWLFYTAAQPELQRQCLAYSDDGIHFHKYQGNPVLSSDMLQENISPKDFRDPKIFKKGDHYYCLAGIRKTDGYGNMILFRTRDFKDWDFKGFLLEEDEAFDESFFKLDGVYECPDYFVLDGEEIVLASLQNLPQIGNRFQNLHSVIYMTGRLDFEKGIFKSESIEDFDSGFDVYACQTMQMPDGRRIMIAWREMWERFYPTEASDWVGSYTLPRELVYKNNRLYQLPVKEIESLRTGKVEAVDIELKDETKRIAGFEGNCLELSVTFDTEDAKKAGIRVFKGSEHETVLYYDKEEETVVFDRTLSGIPLSGKEENVNVRACDVGNCNEISFRVFLDICSVELFIDGGRYVMTGNVYPDPDDRSIEFFSEGKAGIIRTQMYTLS